MTYADLLDDRAVPRLDDPADQPFSGSTWRANVREFARHPLGTVGLATIALMVAFCFIGPLVYHTDQLHPVLTRVNLAPGSRFPLGTDSVGFNVLGRLMVAGQSSLEVGLAAAAIAVAFGGLWGSLAGFVGGWVDAVMMRVVDALIAVPSVLLVLLLAALVRPSVLTVIYVLGAISWLTTARLVRGEILVLRTHDYVAAARLAGARSGTIVVRHLLRNVVGTVASQATFEVANAILLLATLSFLGLGPPPPAVNWGGMLTTGLNLVFEGYWWQIYPAGLCIVVTVVAFNLLGDAARETFEVRLRHR